MPDSVGEKAFSSVSALRDANRNVLDRLAEVDSDVNSQSFLDEIEQFQAQAAATGLFLSALEDRAEAQSIISFWMTVLLTHNRTPDMLLLAAFDSEAARQRAGNAPPYKGLEPFQVEDSGWFFGRHKVIAAMLDKLAEHRLLAVTGLSGSGKSSVVRAGLIPRLREGDAPGSSKWLILDPVVPGAKPAEVLAAVARSIDPEHTDLDAPTDFVAALDRAGRPVLVSIDQFEELFTLCEADEERQAFLDALVCASETGAFRHIMLVTMRSEYDAQVEKHAAFAELFGAGRVQVGALSAQELRTAIEQPAAQVGVLFEQGLSDELVQRVLGEPAGLPLLQFTLLELWKRQSPENRLTWHAYRTLGASPREILTNRARDVYDSIKVRADQTLTRRIFMTLVQIGSGLEPTSRRVQRSELDRLGPRDNVDRVLGIWQDNGLIRVSPPGAVMPASQVEVAHEALIGNWDLLREWIEDRFAAARRRRVLTELARAWHETPDTLLGELSVIEAEALDDLTGEERDYVDASRAEVDRANSRIRRLKQLAFIAAAAGIVLLILGAGGGLYGFSESARAAEATNILAQKQGQFIRILNRGTSTLNHSGSALVDTGLELGIARTELGAVRSDVLRARRSVFQMQQRVARQQSLMRTAQQQGIEDLEVMEGRLNEARSQNEQAGTRSLDLFLTLGEIRPAILLGRDWPVPGAWSRLGEVREQIDRFARSVGRLRDSTGRLLSTTFMVGDRIAIVSDDLLTTEGRDRLANFDGWSIDFRSRPDEDQRHSFAIEAIVGEIRLGDSGIARHVLVRVAATNALGEPPPAALRLGEVALRGSGPASIMSGPIGLHPGSAIYIIGYPVADGNLPDLLNDVLLADPIPMSEVTLEMVQRLVRGEMRLPRVEGARRLSPGFFLSLNAGILQYDSRTFPGSGGSPVIDLQTGLVVGIHYGGAENRKSGMPFTHAFFESDGARAVGLTAASAPFHVMQ